MRYKLDKQIGFLLRKASQRNSEVFNANMPEELTPTRFAALAKLSEIGDQSQNELGRNTAMDIATIKGVVDRLKHRELISTKSDPDDGRKTIVGLTKSGRNLVDASLNKANMVSTMTLKNLSKEESKMLLKLLKKLCSE